VFHEFAHQLDDLSGYTDGAPILSKGQNPVEWDKAFNDAFPRHIASVERGEHTFIDPYGATNPAEFFAVLVEVFFEKPDGLKQAEPAIYEQLVAYFKLDPSGW